jgi:endonuclease V-like protein UPF0215 family
MRWLFLAGLALAIFNLVVSKATGMPVLTALLSAFPNFWLMTRVFPALQEQEDENFARKMTASLNGGL